MARTIRTSSSSRTTASSWRRSACPEQRGEQQRPWTPSAASPRSRSTHAANEAYIADGYGNKRVAVIDMNTGKIKRFWGAYGNVPSDTQPRAVQPGRAARAAVPQPGALRRADDRRAGLRVRPPERSHPGVPQGRHVREGSAASRRARSATARCGTSRSRATRSRSTCTSPTARTSGST